MISCVSNSYDEPFAMCRKRTKSLFIDLPAPSAMFELIDFAHWRMWETMPYNSDFGNRDVYL